MPFDFVDRKRNRSDADARRIYVCDGGDICVETKHTRHTFSPEEFIGLLRAIAMKDKKRFLPTIQKRRAGKTLRAYFKSRGDFVLGRLRAVDFAGKRR